MKVKKRILHTKEDIKRMCDEEVNRMYPMISRDVCYQVLAVTFIVLNREYGFGEKRLNDVKDWVETEYFKMQESPCGIKYDPDDAIRICKERWGIDFNVSQFKE